MMNKLNLFEKQWCDIVFENRNQAYGAYQLRKEDSGRTVFAMFATIGGLAIILGLSYAGQNVSIASNRIHSDGGIIVDLPPVPFEEKVIDPVIEKPEHTTLKDMVKDVIFKIEKDILANHEVKSNDDLLNKNTGNHDSKGTNGNTDFIDEGGDGGLGDPKDILEDKQVPLTFVEVMPVFMGGEDALFQYLSNNIKYPAFEKENNISGTVFIKFVVGKNGEISDLEVLKGVKHGPGLEKEALRVISQMPKWKAGKQNGNAVAVYFTLPVKFTLRN